MTIQEGVVRVSRLVIYIQEGVVRVSRLVIYIQEGWSKYGYPYPYTRGTPYALHSFLVLQRTRNECKAYGVPLVYGQGQPYLLQPSCIQITNRLTLTTPSCIQITNRLTLTTPSCIVINYLNIYILVLLYCHITSYYLSSNPLEQLYTPSSIGINNYLYLSHRPLGYPQMIAQLFIHFLLYTDRMSLLIGHQLLL